MNNEDENRIVEKLTAATPPPRITYLKLFSAIEDWPIDEREWVENGKHSELRWG